ncbi:aminotransferase class IV [Paenibacillus methanolicus]|uniref:4-amino-4-deoxychorismate lyase n=1 Tax=Paenibacillus methanolicus TaxID=582686 RepID=A0A5S5BLU5_9BACL|nr:aminotransferase class IV [Paenibacillus methanolicus]TYP68029.1 4-amino-4-deoxychorismate lyase [Paenibacillus methanolicus]
MKVGWNGSIIHAEEAVIPVYDHGFLYGIGLFETFRTYGGRPYLLERHLERLAEGCRELGIRCETEPDAIRAWLADVMAANHLNEAYVRLTVTAGEAELGLPQHDYEMPNKLLLVKPLPDMSERLYREGKELALLHTRRNTPEGPVRFKSLHYMNNILAKRELRGIGAAANAEGLMLTREGWLSEGIVSNLFFLKDGIVHTPSVDTGILPGITRARVMELASTAGFRVQEGHYTWEELTGAQEVWVTNSIQELVSISTLRANDGVRTQVGDGTAGPVATLLLGAYRSEAGAEG